MATATLRNFAGHEKSVSYADSISMTSVIQRPGASTVAGGIKQWISSVQFIYNKRKPRTLVAKEGITYYEA